MHQLHKTYTLDVNKQGVITLTPVEKKGMFETLLDNVSIVKSPPYCEMVADKIVEFIKHHKINLSKACRNAGYGNSYIHNSIHALNSKDKEHVDRLVKKICLILSAAGYECKLEDFINN